jgi:hypothetical protein
MILDILRKEKYIQNKHILPEQGTNRWKLLQLLSLDRKKKLFKNWGLTKYCIFQIKFILSCNVCFQSKQPIIIFQWKFTIVFLFFNNKNHCFSFKISVSGPQPNEMEQFTKNNGIQHKFTAPCHPATNGQGPRWLCRTCQGDLNMKLNILNKNPAELMFNRPIRTHLDQMKRNITTGMNKKWCTSCENLRVQIWWWGPN